MCPGVVVGYRIQEAIRWQKNTQFYVEKICSLKKKDFQLQNVGRSLKRGVSRGTRDTGHGTRDTKVSETKKKMFSYRDDLSYVVNLFFYKVV